MKIAIDANARMIFEAHKGVWQGFHYCFLVSFNDGILTCCQMVNLSLSSQYWFSLELFFKDD